MNTGNLFVFELTLIDPSRCCSLNAKISSGDTQPMTLMCTGYGKLMRMLILGEKKLALSPLAVAVVRDQKIKITPFRCLVQICRSEALFAEGREQTRDLVQINMPRTLLQPRSE
jgi:hypothetical protein